MQVNRHLVGYSRWHDLQDAWVVLALDDVQHVFDWRLQAERAMAAAGKPGMSDAGVRDFVSRYIPAYAAYLPGLYSSARGGGVGGKPTLLVRVDGKRNAIADAKE
eukprot:4498481-Pleurochrysis_carterae.AAC.1